MKVVIEESDLLEALAQAFFVGKITLEIDSKSPHRVHARNTLQSLYGTGVLSPLRSLSMDDIVREAHRALTQYSADDEARRG